MKRRLPDRNPGDFWYGLLARYPPTGTKYFGFVHIYGKCQFSMLIPTYKNKVNRKRLPWLKDLASSQQAQKSRVIDMTKFGLTIIYTVRFFSTIYLLLVCAF